MVRPAWFHAKRREKQAERRRQSFIIAKSAVKGFLARPREDYRWLKTLSDREVREYVYELWNAFPTRPRLAQLVGLAIGMEQQEFLFNYDCGVGKSALLLWLAHIHSVHSEAKRWLVLVPNIVNIQAWEDQITEHAPYLIYEKLLGSREKRHQLVNQKAQVYLLNYAGLQSYMTQTKEVERKRKGKSEMVVERVINPHAGDAFAEQFDGVIFDEIHNVGNKDSLTYWLCKRISKAVRFRYGSSATLFNYDPAMMWSQFDLVDQGYTLGETMGLFKAAFYYQREHDWKGVEEVFDEGKRKLLNEVIQHRSLFYSAAECGDVPKVSNIPERLTWSDEAKLYYDRVKEECKIAGQEARLNPNAYIRMRQITSGYVGYETDDGRAKLVFDENPKLERLLQLIREIPPDCKIMVYHEYQFTHTLICDALAKRKIPFAELWGKSKDAAAQYSRFLEDHKCRIMVANYRMVAGGNPHKVCNYMYYFESPPDPITRKQSYERIVRPGQPRKAFCYDPHFPGDVGEKILMALKHGQNFYQQVVQGKAKA